MLPQKAIFKNLGVRERQARKIYLYLALLLNHLK